MPEVPDDGGRDWRRWLTVAGPYGAGRHWHPAPFVYRGLSPDQWLHEGLVT